jgi:hypothetical protein
MGNVESLCEIDFPTPPPDLHVQIDRTSIMIDAFHSEIITISIKMDSEREFDEEMTVRVAAVVAGETCSDTLTVSVRKIVGEEEDTKISFDLIPFLIVVLFVIIFFTAMLILWSRTRMFRKN